MKRDSGEIGNVLREMRIKSGFTQEEVAQILDIPRPAISQIEKGKRAVKSDELYKMAQLFSKPLSFFETIMEGKTLEESGALAVLLRAETLKEEDKVEIKKGYDLYQKYHELETILDIKKDFFAGIDLPTPRNKLDAIRQGERLAVIIRSQLRLGLAPIRNIAALLTSQGIRIIACKFKGDMSGAFIFDESLGSCILVNIKHPASRQTFTIAHEFCHTLIDRNKIAQVDFIDPGDDPLETRANVFASHFLMPNDALVEFLRYMGIKGKKHDYDPYDVAHIAYYFTLSHLAVLYRLKDYKALSEEKFEQLKQTNWRKVADTLDFPKDIYEIETGDEMISKRSPEDSMLTQERLRHLAIEAYRRSLISLRKLGEFLGKNYEEVRRFVYDAQIEVV